MANDTTKRIAEWLATGERGQSSEAIAITVLGGAPYPHWPRDPGDLRRCALLLDAVSEAWWDGVLVLVKREPHWLALARWWPDLVALLREEIGPDLRKAGRFDRRRPAARRTDFRADGTDSRMRRPRPRLRADHGRRPRPASVRNPMPSVRLASAAPRSRGLNIQQWRGLLIHGGGVLDELTDSDGRIDRGFYSRELVRSFAAATRRNSTVGRCRWCRTAVARPARYWHPECLTAYAVAQGRQYAGSYALVERTACEDCREPAAELDHRTALSVAWLSQNRKTILRAYSTDNLRWLCHPCHTGKTAADRLALVPPEVRAARAHVRSVRDRRKAVADAAARQQLSFDV